MKIPPDSKSPANRFLKKSLAKAKAKTELKLF